MAPSRKSQQNAPLREHYQHIKYTLRRLGDLARVDGLQGFADAVVWAEQISSYKSALIHACTADNGGDADSYQDLLRRFYVAIGNGYKQLTLNWPQDVPSAAAHAPYDPTFLEAVKAVSFLSRVLCHCKALAWYKEQHSILEVDAALQAGFLQHVTPLITKVLPALQETASATAQHPAYMLYWPQRTVATYLLELWCNLFQHWPGCKLTDNEPLAATIAPVASLAVALICAVPADAAPANSNESGTRRAAKVNQHEAVYCDRDLWSDCCHTSLRIVHSLLLVVCKECCPSPKASVCNSNYGHTVEAALASDGVQKLILLGLGAAAAVMHRRQALGPSAAASVATNTATKHVQQEQQQQQPNCGHLLLLAGVGLSDGDRFIKSALSCSRSLDAAPLIDGYSHTGFRHHMELSVVHMYSRYCHLNSNLAGEDSSSTGNSNTGGVATSPLLQQQVMSVLHTLKDLTLLLPDTDADSIGKIIWVFGSVCQAVMKQPCLGPKELQQVLQWLLQPLYHKICKVYSTVEALSQQHPSTRGTGLAAAGLNPEPTRTWAVAIHMFLASSEAWVEEYLVAAIQQDPTTSLAAIEAVVRICSTCIDSKQQQLLQPASQVATTVLRCLAQQDISQDMLAEPSVQEALQSLMLCTLKLLMVISDLPQTSTTHISNGDTSALHSLLADLQYVFSLVYRLNTLKQPPTSIQDSQRSAVTDAPYQVAWPIVIGKGMYAGAVSLRSHMPLDDVMPLISLYPWMDQPHQGSSPALVAPDIFGTAAAAAAEIEGLLLQLSKSFMEARKQGTCQQEASTEVRQLLQQCGSAICAALPVKFCCNNPACVNLTKLSEQQLVAGRGSRCSGCKVARYCGRECQKEHWKQHKQACKTIQAEAAVIDKLKQLLSTS